MGGFITKVDFSNNRQIKQFEKTETALSGSTVFGLTYSALTAGPDLTSTGVTDYTSGITSTFSGDTGTTIFNIGDARMVLGADTIDVLTPSNSGTTQYIGPTFTAATSTTIDGNIVNLTYSGVIYTITVTSMEETSPGIYTGVTDSNLTQYSAGTLDFTGRTIWADVNGITRTERLIIKDNPTIGYVLTCLDGEGMTSWGPPTSGGTTLWSASSGTHSAVLKYSNSTASGILSLAHGSGCTASGLISYAEGALTTASNSGSHAEGYLTVASGLLSHSEGNRTTASGNDSHAEGRETIAGGTSSHAEGSQTITSGNNSHSEGNKTTASGNDSHAEGNQTTASGTSSHAEGGQTIASGNNSHSEGNRTTASGNDSHAEGYLTTAIGGSSHVEGDRTTAIENSSHAEGRLTIASGISSHAEGYESTAIGPYSHAEGYQTTVIGNDGHAEGNQTIAGIRSHAEGDNSVATGDTSHAEGYYTTSIGFGSHSEGYYTTAIGFSSHAGGQSYFSSSPVISEGAASFNHSITLNGYTSNTLGNYSVILGGKNNNTAITGEGTVMLGCNTKTGDKPYTTYVNNFYNYGNHYVNITEVTGNTYSVTDGDYIIHVICSSASTITIPTAQIINNRVFIIKDAIFSAFTNNITIETQGSELIEGESNLIIDTDGDAYQLYCYNGNLFIS